VTSPDFEFLVEESFTITDRGVGVFGPWRSGGIRSGDSDYLHTPGLVVPVDRITVEYVRLSGGADE
jgi:translation elongation factor EF-Tu-like GTPase